MAVLIRGKRLPLPILQGGMGVGVSLERLAGAVAERGGMGTISTALCGYKEPDFPQRPQEANLRALDRQVRRAKELSKSAGLVAVNAMVATSQYADSVRTALRAGADAIVCGAGLPKDLPALAAQVPESDAADGFKKRLLDARPEDIAIVQSPVGMPGRALRSPLIRQVEAGTQPRPERCVNCLVPCDPKTTPYCISKALIAACCGDWENGLFFCGANAGEVNRLSTVGEQMEQIMEEWRNAQ